MQIQHDTNQCHHEMRILFSNVEKGVRNEVRECTKCNHKDTLYFRVKSDQKEE